MKSLIKGSLFYALVVAHPNAKLFNPNDPIWTDAKIAHHDIAINGGQAGGVYTALRLQQQGRDIALLESGNRLGPDQDTYTDPETGLSIDYSVVQDSGGWHGFDNLNTSRSLFKYMGLRTYDSKERTALIKAKETSVADFLQEKNMTHDHKLILPQPDFISFMSGQKIPYSGDFPFLSQVQWKEIKDRYAQYIDYDVSLPKPIPEILYKPTGEVLLDDFKLWTVADSESINPLVSALLS